MCQSKTLIRGHDCHTYLAVAFCIFQALVREHLPTSRYNWSQGCPLTEGLIVHNIVSLYTSTEDPGVAAWRWGGGGGRVLTAALGGGNGVANATKQKINDKNLIWHVTAHVT